MSDIISKAPTGNVVFYRTYSRKKEDGVREFWDDVCDRTITGLIELGQLTPEEGELIRDQAQELKCLPSGRWLWVGGTEWSKQPENFYGTYNCSCTDIVDWEAFGLMMKLAMQGCGTGANLEPRCIGQLPPIVNKLEIEIVEEIGAFYGQQAIDYDASKTRTFTKTTPDFVSVSIFVGDSRQGWVDSYQKILELASHSAYSDFPKIKVGIYLGDVRPAGEPLKGFGGVANPVKLPEMYVKMADILNGAVGRQLNSLECCLLIDEAALVVVAGSIRRSAGLRLFSSEDKLGETAKDNLWQVDEQGTWRIDPKRDALRMANHTRAFHQKPDLETCINSVRKQVTSGEGAIMWVGEAIARANADLLYSPGLKKEFIERYNKSSFDAKEYLRPFQLDWEEKELDHRMQRYGLNPCGEIILNNNFCNLSEVHLINLDPFDLEAQEQAFRAGALSVAALLHHRFVDERYKYSREVDLIVGVSFTGLFDFFVKAFGVDWLRWWQEGRCKSWYGYTAVENFDRIIKAIPLEWVKEWNDTGILLQDRSVADFYRFVESKYLSCWSEIAHKVVWAYCDRHNLRRPNRCTTVQPAGSKSLLTGSSPGWHPPFAARYIRRITFRRDDPVALACMDQGYSVVPSQSDKDEQGNLLNDPFDPRCAEWLVEIPVELPWANLPGVEDIQFENFSALAQLDFWMQVQKHYTTHNTSATIKVSPEEVEEVGQWIYNAIQDDEGYISCAILARDNAPYPRMPFEKIDKEQYQKLQAQVLSWRKPGSFYERLTMWDRLAAESDAPLEQVGPAGCDSDKCMLPLKQPE